MPAGRNERGMTQHLPRPSAPQSDPSGSPHPSIRVGERYF